MPATLLTAQAVAPTVTTAAEPKPDPPRARLHERTGEPSSFSASWDQSADDRVGVAAAL